MSAATLPLPRTAAPPDPLRWVLFAGCAVAFFVLAYSSAITWSEVQEAHRHGFSREAAALTRAVASGSGARQAAGVGLGVLGLLALLARRADGVCRPRGVLAWAVLVFLALSAASVGWADDLPVSLRRVAALGLVVMAVAGLVRTLPPDAVVTFTFLASGAYVLVAAGVELATGALHPGAEGYRLSGVFHPNTTGSFAALLALAATSPAAGPRRRRVAAFVVALAVLLLTRSRSNLGALVVALSARWVIAAGAARLLRAAVVLAWVGCLALFVAGDRPSAAVVEPLLTSRPDSELATLSGRTALWDQLLGYAAERPVLGHGVGGFWGPRHVQAVYAAQRWPAADAHSTYLELLLDVGAVGLALFLAVLGAAAWRAVPAARAGGVGPFVLSVVVYYAVEGVVETLQPAATLVTFVFFWSVGLLAFRAAAELAGGSRCAST